MRRLSSLQISDTCAALRALALAAVLALAATAAAGPVVIAVSAAQSGPTRIVYHAVVVHAPNPEVGGRWGERTAAAGNLDGDAAPDFWVGDPQATVGGTKEAGRVYAMDGRTLKPLFTIDPPQPQTGVGFGFFITNVGDVNGDGIADLAVGTDAQNVDTGSGSPCGTPKPNGCHEGQGEAWVFSGANGHLLYALNNPQPQGSPQHHARFGSRIGNAGDLEKDGVDEIIVGASGNSLPAGCADVTPIPAGCRVGQGQAFIFNGKSGALMRTLNLPTEDEQPCSSGCGSFGLAVQSPGDTDGDGVPDQLVSAPSNDVYKGSGPPCGAPKPNGCNPSQGRMYLFSGRTGELLRRIDDPQPQAGAFFGFQDVAPMSPGDVNGDGAADVYGEGWLQNGSAGQGQGKAWIFDGRTGKVLYTLDDPQPTSGAQFGWAMAADPHPSGAGPLLILGASPHHVSGTVQNGLTELVTAADGAPVATLSLPRSYRQRAKSTGVGPNLGWTVSAPGDLDRNGLSDYIAGAPFADVNGRKAQGIVVVFLAERQSISVGGGPAHGSGTSYLPAIAVAGGLIIVAAVAVVLSRRRRGGRGPNPTA